MGSSLRKYNLSDLEQTLPDLVQQVTSGEEVVLLKDELPVAKIVPFAAKTARKRSFGDVKGISISPRFHETPEEFDA